MIREQPSAPLLLRENQYGTSSVRLMKIFHHADRHDLKEVTANIRLEGDFEASYSFGDNTRVLPADTIKNTVYALANRHGLEQVEEFGLVLARHFLESHPQLSRVRVELVEHRWNRMLAGGRPHASAFLRAGEERRTASVTGARAGFTVESGIAGLAMLKSAQSAFEGFARDAFTTLAETSDRLFATVLRAVWEYRGPETAFGLSWHGVRQTLLDTFAEHESRSAQHTLYAMGEAVLETHEDVLRISLSMPDMACIPVDLTPFGMENKNEIFAPTAEPRGVIEATLEKQA